MNMNRVIVYARMLKTRLNSFKQMNGLNTPLTGVDQELKFKYLLTRLLSNYNYEIKQDKIKYVKLIKIN